MITLNYDNLFKIDDAHGLSKNDFLEYENKVKEFLNKIENRNQGFYKIVDDETAVEKIEEYTQRVKGKFNHVVVLGIGGSALGAICLKKSLKHLFENELKTKTAPRLHVLDNIDPTLISEIDDIIDYEKTLFIVISKSGGTPETLALYFHFREIFKRKNLDLKKHFVFITGHTGFLREQSEKHEIETFEIPENVGGRFSVLTAVGLLPSSLIETDIRAILKGAREMRDYFTDTDFEKNMPFKIALIQYLLGEKGKTINVLMPYSQRLTGFADWYRQLLAESIGKKENVGLTPVNALGATDQHSQSQLYNDGPNDKFLMFIKVNNMGPEIKIPADESAAYLKNVSLTKLLHTEMRGTIDSLTKNNRPNITFEIPQVDEYHMGALFMLFEGATAFLGELYQINAFDQPGVELSKKITKQLLTN